jgi:hypothetical protein
MRIDIAPSTDLQKQENGLINLVARYLQPSNQINLVRCNGIMGVCHRDEEANWHRNFDSCFNCMSQRVQVANWTGSQLQDLSSYLTAEDVDSSRKWVNSLSQEELITAHFDGCTPWDWVNQFFKARFSQSIPTPSNRQHDYFVRKLYLSIVRIRIAARRYLFANKPEKIILPVGNDLINQALSEVAIDFGIGLYTVKWRNDLRLNEIEDYHASKSIQSEVVVGSVFEIRSEPETWPLDLLNKLEEIVDFMGLETPKATSNQFKRTA